MIVPHIISLIFAFSVMAFSDHEGFLWFTGKKQVLDGKKMKKYHSLMWTAIILMIITGFALFWPERNFLLERGVFYLKMSFVAALLINAFVIGKFIKVAETKPFAVLTVKEKAPLFISGAASVVCWAGATIAAFFLFPE